MSLPELLKLVALDEEDLKILSAHAQDAVLKIGDIAFRPKERRFALAMNRFDWTGAAAFARRQFERRRSILHFDRVLSVSYSGLNRDAEGAVLELLAVNFDSIDPPSGTITLTFAGGGAIRLTVECIEAYLTDLGGAWATSAKPGHDVSDSADDKPGSP